MATVEILRAAVVKKVRLPLWLEQPTKPRSLYHWLTQMSLPPDACDRRTPLPAMVLRLVMEFLFYHRFF